MQYRVYWNLKVQHKWVSNVLRLPRSSRRLPSPSTRAVKRDVNLIQFPIGKASCFSDRNSVENSPELYKNSDAICPFPALKVEKDQITSNYKSATYTSFVRSADDSSLVFLTFSGRNSWRIQIDFRKNQTEFSKNSDRIYKEFRQKSERFLVGKAAGFA